MRGSRVVVLVKWHRENEELELRLVFGLGVVVVVDTAVAVVDSASARRCLMVAVLDQL